MHAIEVIQTGPHRLEAEQNGFVIPMSTKDEDPNIITSPKRLMLIALAGCTAFDLVSLLEKMKVEYDDFKVSATGELTDTHPKTYHSVHLIYFFKGDKIDKHKVKHAIDLSQEKYCGVSAMFRMFSKLTWEIVYEEGNK